MRLTYEPASEPRRLLMHGEARVRRLALVALLYLTRRLAPEPFWYTPNPI